MESPRSRDSSATAARRSFRAALVVLLCTLPFLGSTREGPSPS
jgi:hypothetical protein